MEINKRQHVRYFPHNHKPNKTVYTHTHVNSSKASTFLVVNNAICTKNTNESWNLGNSRNFQNSPRTCKKFKMNIHAPYMVVVMFWSFNFNWNFNQVCIWTPAGNTNISLWNQKVETKRNNLGTIILLKKGKGPVCQRAFWRAFWPKRAYLTKISFLTK